MTTASRTVSVDRLAAEFARRLRRDLGLRKLAVVVKRNAAETNPSVCHSHDFCDANEVMRTALEALGLDPVATHEARPGLWVAAWDLARRRGFHRHRRSTEGKTSGRERI